MDIDWNTAAVLIDRINHKSPDVFDADMQCLKIAVRTKEADLSFASAGHSVAASVLTAAIITGKAEIIKSLLDNHWKASSRENFVFLFASCLLYRFLKIYLDDALSVRNDELDSLHGVPLLQKVLQSLAFESGELVEVLGFYS